MKPQPDPIVSIMYLLGVLELVATKWMPADWVTSRNRTGAVSAPGRAAARVADPDGAVPCRQAAQSSSGKEPQIRTMRRRRAPLSVIVASLPSADPISPGPGSAV